MRRLSENSFACNLQAMSGEEREQHELLSRQLFALVAEVREVRDGYAFRLAGPISLVIVAQWVELESKCCPFFDFNVALGRQQGPLWLRVTGQSGVKKAIRAEFPWSLLRNLPEQPQQIQS
jgi:hypothetical protein